MAGFFLCNKLCISIFLYITTFFGIEMIILFNL